MMFRKLEGTTGSVVIPSIGLNVGTMNSWTLSRREDPPPGSGEWGFRAVFSYVNEFAWNSPDWIKEIRITIGPVKTGNTFRLIPNAPERMALEGKSLYIEGVDIERI